MLLFQNPLDSRMKFTGSRMELTASEAEWLDSKSGQTTWLSDILLELAEMTIPVRESTERLCLSGAGWPGCGSLTIDTITREVRSGAAISRPRLWSGGGGLRVPARLLAHTSSPFVNRLG